MSIHGKGGEKSLWHWNPNCTPSPLLLLTYQPSYSLLKADCKELNCFHMSSSRTEFVAFGNPCCIQLQLLPVCSPGRPPVHACVCVCECVGARAHARVLVTSEPGPHRVGETGLPLLGEILIQNSFFPLLSYAQSWPRTMSNNIQPRKMQINLSLHSPAMQLAAHFQDTKLVYTWYTKNAG